MITIEGYSKAPIAPEGIAITWVKDIVEARGGLSRLIAELIEQCAQDDFWLQTCQRKPAYDVAYVYIIYQNKVILRCQYAGWCKAGGDFSGLKMPYSAVLMTGPVINAPVEIIKPGFQGFRYTTKLF